MRAFNPPTQRKRISKQWTDQCIPVCRGDVQRIRFRKTKGWDGMSATVYTQSSETGSKRPLGYERPDGLQAYQGCALTQQSQALCQAPNCTEILLPSPPKVALPCQNPCLSQTVAHSCSPSTAKAAAGSQNPGQHWLHRD